MIRSDPERGPAAARGPRSALASAWLAALLTLLAVPALAATLEDVRERGAVRCGVNTNLTGFSTVNSLGAYSGFDVDLCRAVAAAVPLAGLRIVQGKSALSLYQFNTATAEHYFCRHCGIYTHHKRRADPSQCGINLGCIEGVKT